MDRRAADVRWAIAPQILLGHGLYKAVVISEAGRVEAIDDAALHPEAIRLPGRVMLPGLVNAHSHAFQRSIRGVTEDGGGAQGNFWLWRDAMYRAANRYDADNLYYIARMAFLEMALSGITTVGEFHYIHGAPNGHPYEDPNRIALLMVKAAREIGIRICLLRVAYERAGFDRPANELQRRFIEPAEAFIRNAQALREQLDGEFAWTGVAPHSVRAVPLPYLRKVFDWAQSAGVPFHMHVSEQPKELEECVAEYGVTPVEMMVREGMVHASFTAVHGIHLTPREIEMLGDRRATVCACPTTERNLGDGIVPVRDLLQAKARIALGTDSQAQIDILEDARELEYHLRLSNLTRGSIAPADLLQAATRGGGESLFLPADAADFFTLDLNDLSIAGVPEKHLGAAIVFGASKSAVRDVIVGGEFIVRDGRHPLKEEVVIAYLNIGK